MKKAKNKMDVQESLDFIIEKMATKSDLADAEQRLGQRIDSISNRIDYEQDKRKQLEVRVTRFEKVR